MHVSSHFERFKRRIYVYYPSPEFVEIALTPQFRVAMIPPGFRSVKLTV